MVCEIQKHLAESELEFHPEELVSSVLEEAMLAARKERSSKVTNYGALL